jgi:hypothetical protein
VFGVPITTGYTERSRRFPALLSAAEACQGLSASITRIRSSFRPASESRASFRHCQPIALAMLGTLSALRTRTTIAETILPIPTDGCRTARRRSTWMVVRLLDEDSAAAKWKTLITALLRHALMDQAARSGRVVIEPGCRRYEMPMHAGRRLGHHRSRRAG